MDEMPFDQDAPAPAATDDAADASAAAGSLVGDLKSMGEKLAAALKAATGTPEAESVKGDMREGLEALQKEIDRALQRVPKPDLQSGVQRGTDAASGATTKLRSEAAGWVREANKALDRLANSLGGADKPGGGPDATPGDGPAA